MWKYLTRVLLIFGSLFLMGCGKDKDYDESENRDIYNCYSYYIACSVDVEQDISRLLQINSQADIDSYVKDTEYICSDLENYLENKTLYENLDITMNSVSVDMSYLKDVNKRYKEFKRIGFIVNATLYTDYEISDVLVYVTYKDNKIVKFEYIGI